MVIVLILLSALLAAAKLDGVLSVSWWVVTLPLILAVGMLIGAYMVLRLALGALNG